MSESFVIYHNPRCRKSREALGELEQKKSGVKVVEYLKTPPSVNELKKMCDYLGLKPFDLVRKGEALYKENYKGKELTDSQWLTVLSANPVLIERPIVVKGGKAVIAREPGALTSFLSKGGKK